LIVSAAGQPPSLSKSEIVIGYWAGDSFQLMPGWRPPLNRRPAVTHWARLAAYLPKGIDLIHERRFDPDAREAARGLPPGEHDPLDDGMPGG